jgi:hypothetical protein
MAVRKGEGGIAAKGGAVAGVIGGAVLSVFMAFMNVAAGRDIWSAMKFAALPLLGERVMQPGFEPGPVLLGLLCHFAVSIGWGVLFGLVFYGFTRSATFIGGALWGIVVWLGMFYIVLPVVGAAQVATMMPAGVAIFEHIVFGLAVGLGFLPQQKPRAMSLEVQRPAAMPR